MDKETKQGRSAAIYGWRYKDEYFYVGRSVSERYKKRQQEHWRAVPERTEWKYQTVREIQKMEENLDNFQFDVLQADVAEGDNAEDRWIRKLLMKGHLLRNMRAGSAWTDIPFNQLNDYLRRLGGHPKTLEEWEIWRNSAQKQKKCKTLKDVVKDIEVRSPKIKWRSINDLQTEHCEHPMEFRSAMRHTDITEEFWDMISAVNAEELWEEFITQAIEQLGDM